MGAVAVVVRQIQIAPVRGGDRVQMESAELKVDSGITGDAYAGPGDRQVVVFSAAARRAVTESVGEHGVCYPRFRENLLIEGVHAGRLEPGTRLGIGMAVLEVTAARKRCFPECTLPRQSCHIRGAVAFCRVITSGEIRVGDDVRVENA